jgi:hypothetical protein
MIEVSAPPGTLYYAVDVKLCRYDLVIFHAATGRLSIFAHCCRSFPDAELHREGQVAQKMPGTNTHPNCMAL